MSIQSNINSAISSIAHAKFTYTVGKKIPETLEDLQMKEYLKEEEARRERISGEAHRLTSFNRLLELDKKRELEGTEPAFGEPSKTMKLNRAIEQLRKTKNISEGFEEPSSISQLVEASRRSKDSLDASRMSKQFKAKGSRGWEQQGVPRPIMPGAGMRTMEDAATHLKEEK